MIMTVELFLFLLSVLSTLTGLVTEGIKKMLDAAEKKYASNIVVLFVSVIVGGIGTIVFYMWKGFAWDALNIISIFLMIGANWLGAMLGYDKIKQAIAQIQNK